MLHLKRVESADGVLLFEHKNQKKPVTLWL